MRTTRRIWFKWTTLLLLPLMGVALAAQQFGNFISIGQSGVAAAYQLDIRDATNRTSIHVRSNATTDDGAYITSEAADEGFYSGGAAFNGTNWVAKASDAGIAGQTGGVWKVFEDITLTPGNTFTPTERFRLTATSAIFSNLTAVRPLTGGATDLGATTQGWNNIFTEVGLVEDAGGAVTRFGMPVNSSNTLIGTQADGAAAIGNIFRTSVSYANATAKIGSFQNLTTEKLAVDLNGKFIIPTAGGAAIVGTATLSAGTVTVSTTAVTASSKIFLTRATTGSNLVVGVPEVGTITAGTSFVIQSITAIGGVAGDNGQINWFIVN